MLKGALGAAAISVVLATTGAGTASADTSGNSALGREDYPCTLYHFCGWDDLGPNPTNRLIDISGAIPCGWTYDLSSGVRNRISSINNMTSGTWQLKDGATVVFTANESSYGFLPPQAQNNVDNLRFICT
ncbi:hypothetical protein BU204_30865 [Actinophytocola xanthii]|uniref:Peptidase inhibitor family I36 n=2 Tax=Actinophytocola xanthii TaxID=1912961 RepID=A0A1Q8C8Z1_9PSEU|nr:hypothetical protein BU204_30865 [Actinophytocola xanthii]